MAAVNAAFFMFPQLETKRFLLRQFEPQDQDFVFKGLSHPEVIRYYGVNYQTFEATKIQLEWFHSLFTDNTGIWWKIVTRGTLDPVGAIGMNNYQQQHNKTEIGYWLLREYWSQGIISEVLETVIGYLQDEKKIHRIEALVENGNTGSCRVLEKAGFICEGILRDCEIKNGMYISLHMYSLLSTDRK